MRTLFICTILLFCHVSHAYEFTLNPMARIRYESQNSYDLEGAHRSLVGSRFWLLSTFKHEDYALVLQPQFARVWGQEIDGLAASGGLVDPTIHMHQAYLQAALHSNINVKLGRQELAYGDELVLGTVGWSHIGRSFDALKLELSLSNLQLDLFASKLVEHNAIGPSLGDKDLYGAYFKMQTLTELFKEVDLYALGLNDKSLSPRQDLIAAGVRLAGGIYNFDHRMEAVYQQVADSNEGQLDAELGFTHAPLGRIALNYFMATEHYQQMFPTSHKWLGIADMIGRRNIQGYQVKLQNNWSPKIKTELSYFNMFRYSTSETAYSLNGSTALGAPGLSSKNIAQEFDLVLNYAHDKNLSYQLGGAVFVPQNYLKESAKNKRYIFAYLHMMLKL